MTEQQQEASEDAVMTRIGQAVILLHAGDREEARNRFGAIWSEIGEEGHSLHRCTLAHYMADAQDDPADELAWDLRALGAAEELRDVPPAHREPHQALRVFYPSLHLSLAADYVKLRRPEAARVHLTRAAPPRARCPTTATGTAYGTPSPGWSGGSRRNRAGTPGRSRNSPPDPGRPVPPRADQSPWRPAQMRASGLSGCQRPCRRPSAHTSAGRTGSSRTSSRSTAAPGRAPCGRPP